MYNLYMNITYKQLWNEIIKHNKFTICTHVFPDGDTIGTAYALKYLILEVKPKAEVKISGEPAPSSLDSVNELENVSDEFFYDSQAIVVDTGSANRISDKRVKPAEALNIDHHHDETKFKMRIGGDHWPAAGQVLYEMIKELDLPLTDKIAKGIFYAIWTDTEGMTQRNINDITREAIKELGHNGIKKECLNSLALPQEIEEIILEIKQNTKSNDKVTWVCKDIEVPKDYWKPIIARLSNESSTEVFISVLRFNNEYIRGSLRSKGNIDISGFAAEFGGGGHFTSAGFLPKSFEEGQRNIEYLINNL